MTVRFPNDKYVSKIVILYQLRNTIISQLVLFYPAHPFCYAGTYRRNPTTNHNTPTLVLNACFRNNRSDDTAHSMFHLLLPRKEGKVLHFPATTLFPSTTPHYMHIQTPLLLLKNADHVSFSRDHIYTIADYSSVHLCTA